MTMRIFYIIGIGFLAAASAQQGNDGPRFSGMIIRPPILPPFPPVPRPQPPPPPSVPVPLTSISVKATVRAWAYDVSANLTYVNKANQTIECQYVFPIADTAAVYKLEVTIGTRKLITEIRNKTEAEEIYRTAVGAGQTAALLQNQQGSPDVYRIMVGNLQPNETATVIIGYAMPIDRDTETGNLAIQLPVVLNPRYVPDRELLENNLRAAPTNFHAGVRYVAASEIRYTFAFSADIDLGIGGNSKIAGIQTGNITDVIQTTYGNGNTTAKVNLTSKFSPDHDFRLLINITQTTPGASIFVEPGVPSSDDAGIRSWLNFDIAAAWYEPLAKSKTGLSIDEYWIVIDQSGSMMGEKIASARTALALLIKSLPVGCQFNVVGFGTRFTLLFNSAVEYNDDNVDAAVSHANGIDADLGGTEVLQPLQHIYRQPVRSTPEGAKRFIILLTDGEVSNTNEVIDTVRRNVNTTRVFSIGIGSGASTALVNGVARVGLGMSEFVRDQGDRLQAKVINILKATRMEAAENVNLTWAIARGGSVTMTSPKVVPLTAFAGRGVAQYAVIDRQRALSGSSRLLASSLLSPHLTNFTIPENSFSEPTDPLPLHRLAAKARLTELTDEIRSSHIVDKNKEKEAIGISIATGVLSEFTAMVAVDEGRRVAADASGKPLFINIERPTVYNLNTYYSGGIATRIGAASMPGRILQAHPGPMMPAYDSFSRNRAPAGPPIGSRVSMGAPGASVNSFQGSVAAYVPPRGESNRPNPVPSVVTSNMDSLIGLQRSIAGSWQLSDNFITVIAVANVTQTDDLRAIAQAVIPGPTNDDELATLTAVAVLRKRFAARRDEWELIEDKALAFLARTFTTIEIDTYVDAIVKALKL